MNTEQTDIQAFYDSSCKSFLESIYSDPKCNWCGLPSTIFPLYRVGLCSHCYNIRSELRKIRKKCWSFEDARKRVPFELIFDWETAVKKAEFASQDGDLLADIHTRKVSGLDLEHALSGISERFVKKDLFYHDAEWLDWCFSASQTRLVYHFLRKLLVTDLRRKRQFEAINHDNLNHELGRQLADYQPSAKPRKKKEGE